jgi:isoleucyl-tRNA synthetase
MEKNFKLYMAQSGRPVQLEKEYNPSVLQKWNNLGLYSTVNKKLRKHGKKPFVFVDGPPYANGGAHMGHVLNKVWKDLTVKSQWFLGNEAKWTPGWDCHGLPLELQVDKKHQQASEEQKKKYCKNLALRSVVLQRNDFKSLGVHADWEKPYLTLSPEMKQASWSTVKEMFDQDLLQYKLWPVHHCPACASSLAEAELEYSNKERTELYFKYRLEDGSYALVWTTTPWTLPMNQALAFNESFQYSVWNKDGEKLYVDQSASEQVKDLLEKEGYENTQVSVDGNFFKEKKGFSPLLNQATPVLHGDFVMEGQTGFVHVSGAHGVEDYELVVANKLEPLNFLDKHGRYEENALLPKEFWGKKNTAVNDVVLEKLSDLLVAKVNTSVETAHCWRHKTKVYYQATWQVFLDLEKLKPRVAQMLSNSNLSDHVRESLEKMLLNRSNWCLSRQRYWGTELNLLVDSKTKKLSPLTSEYLAFYANGDEHRAEEMLKVNEHLYVVNDVLDVWFDSGNVVYALGQMNGFEQADMVLEGKDQYRGWFQSLLWMQAVHYKQLPYKNLFVHGFVLDDKKMKFSKSSGNGVTAKEAVELFGADALRLWAAMQEEETDAVFSDKKLAEAKSYYQRLHLTLRFLSSNAYEVTNNRHYRNMEKFLKKPEFDFYRFVLSKTQEMKNEFSEALQNYEYKKALQLLYTFSDKFLSQFVFEVMKQPLYLKSGSTLEKRMVQTCAYQLHYEMLRMVAVFCPFVAEEFMEATTLKDTFKTVFTLDETNFEYKLENNWELVLDMRKLVNQKLEPLQQQKLAKGSNQLYCEFQLDKENLSLWEKLNKVMPTQYLLGVSEATAKLGEGNDVELYNLNDNSEYEKCPRCWNYDRKHSFVNGVCSHCSNDA